MDTKYMNDLPVKTPPFHHSPQHIIVGQKCGPKTKITVCKGAAILNRPWI